MTNRDRQNMKDLNKMIRDLEAEERRLARHSDKIMTWTMWTFVTFMAFLLCYVIS